MALACREALEAAGVEAELSRFTEEDDRLYEEIAECAAFGPDCAVEIHNNAGGGDGFEAYIQTGGFAPESRELAAAIESEVLAMGQNSRGLKTRQNGCGEDWFGWLRQNDCPAVLLEGFFLDSDDRLIGDTAEEQRAFGQAYAAGILRFLNVAPEEEAKETDGADGSDELSRGDTGDSGEAGRTREAEQALMELLRRLCAE